MFGFFPHQTKSEGGLPAASVRKGDWKFIRFFGEGLNGNDATVLYHLASDIGKRNDLSTSQPDKVKELNAILDGYLKDTQALLPVKNPAYDPAAAAPAEGKKKRKSIENGDD